MKYLRCQLLVMIALSSLVYCTVTEAQAEGRTIAFVVGVQNYDEPELNKLQFTAKDAKDVFFQIQAVSRGFDLSRSRLLLATDETVETGDAEGDSFLLQQDRLTENTVRSEFRRFLQTVKSNDTIILYFGGHGTDQADKYLLFLPSDFSSEPADHYLRYDDLLRDIQGVLEDARLSNVSTIFFANMCGAGTAAGTMNADAEFDADFVREWQQNNTLGFERFAFIPATAKLRNTHEDQQLQRSVFAHHLLNGLSGAAALQGTITTDSLFNYLDTKIEDNLPRHPDAFDGAITVGITRDQDALISLVVGTSVLATAQDTHNSLLSELAEVQLKKAEFNRSFSGVARYRSALSKLGNDPEAAIGLLKLAADHTVLPDDFIKPVANVLEQLQRTATPFRSLRSVHESLAGGYPFYSLLVNFNREDSSTENQSTWRTLMRQFDGHEDVGTVDIDSTFVRTSEADAVMPILPVIDGWINDAEIASGADVPHLLLMFTGRASVETAREATIIIEQLSTTWPGQIVAIYSLPFPGELLAEGSGRDIDNVSLLLSGDAKNAMSFGKPNEWLSVDQLVDDDDSDPVTESRFQASSAFGSTANLLVYALLKGVEDLDNWELSSEFVRRKEAGFNGNRNMDWIVDKPIWIPRWQTDADAMRRSVFLQPLRRWTALLGAGCAVDRPMLQCQDHARALMALDSVETTSTILREDLFSTLKLAAMSDISGEVHDAQDGYRRFISAIEKLEATSDSISPTIRKVNDIARLELERLIGLIEDRLQGLGGKSLRRIKVLSVSVNDYESPLVVDLRNTDTDIQAWHEYLEARFASDVELLNPLENPANVSEIIEYITENIAASGSDDLFVFLYSGRGYELGEDRYITSASASDPNIDLQGFININEIARTFSGHWLFATYDTQFTAPVLDEARKDGLYAKHIDSVRPIPAAYPVNELQPSGFYDTLPRDAEKLSRATSRLVNGDNIADKQTHIFWEGQLTELIESNCDVNDKAIHSPLSAALLSVLSENLQSGMSYKELAEKSAVHHCLGEEGRYGQLVLQGGFDLPVFGTGEAVERISYFQGNDEQRELNLRTAVELSKWQQSLSNQSVDKLTLAAMQIELVALRSNWSGSMYRAEESNELIAEALRFLLQVDEDTLMAEYPELRGAVLELESRALSLDGRGEEARRLLLDAPLEKISRQSSYERLISLTEQALRREPAALVLQTQKRIAELKTEMNAHDSNLDAGWQTLMESVLLGLQEPYEISTVEKDAPAH